MCDQAPSETVNVPPLCTTRHFSRFQLSSTPPPPAATPAYLVRRTARLLDRDAVASARNDRGAAMRGANRHDEEARMALRIGYCGSHEQWPAPRLVKLAVA